jgi:hypothetical protein
MAKRYKVRRKKSKKMFTRSARRVRSQNFYMPMRGGIRM